MAGRQYGNSRSKRIRLLFGLCCCVQICPPGVFVPKVRQRPALFLVLAALAIGAHVALNVRFTSQTESISDIFFLVISLSAGGVIWWNVLRRAPAMRKSWGLLAAALVIWFAATVMASSAHFLHIASPTTANLDDFFYFFYGVPILLAIAAPDDSHQDALFFWFDGIQAAAVGFLAYIELFAVIPLSGAIRHPIPVARLIWIYDIEALILALFATARMLVSPPNTAYRRFFQILVAFLWTYGVCTSIYNHIVSAHLDAGILDALVDVPFFLLIGLAAFSSELPVSHTELQTPKPVAVFIDNARPTLLGLALVLLSTVVARHHFKMAMGAILGAFLLYGARSAMLQMRLLETQRLLETANTRLSDMTLEDGLTGVANRRCFDQRLQQEWGRAHRTHTPLSLLLVDIDHFKVLNDTYGHLAGDECLIQVARLLRGVLRRPADLLARYGGEEFVALLPETDEAGAQNLAYQMQASLLTSEPVCAIDRQVTVSIGVTTWLSHKHATAQQFVDTADRALYNAKQNGRNRIEVLPLDRERNQAAISD